ncbi:hypothetical protein M670_01225 [Schinkia azotoformans MEV2011]|uniref:Uncharacterized protein n=1 Tax=Schinkia azotoformans MEV2011 TaxID=1348973 RepID=A0A072NQD1_SCHAZ|nr:hypothetical protein [Schinkia azotoformans]KEF39457.1 hypothetical protein M670_01225 [Schinkia azotoformans MEV2011]MEC1696841.1 hypothetical protein [Schinkia azotoformans]MEC1726626.1 hypothetical protein [Schinkia azotoformans]MEC1780597.1 hypothetical protein [Schinkia azotoformans]MED4331272.1 hypothetical protein [Schinkia azotoformans]
MEVYVFGVIFILILLPILYFIPIGISLKEKILIALVSFILAEIGLFLNKFLGIWKTLLLLVLFAVVVTYIVETRIRPRMGNDKGGRKALPMDNGNNQNALNIKDEPSFLENDLDNESDGDYDLGQEAIDRLLTEMKKSKTEQIEEIPNASLADIHNHDLDIQNEDYIEPVENMQNNKEITDDELEVIQPVNSLFEKETDFNVNEMKEFIDEPEEDLSQLAKSIDANFEIDFEKQLETYALDDNNYYEENKPYEAELLFERIQLFEHLEDIEGGIAKEVFEDIKLTDEVEEGQTINSFESIEDLLEEVDPNEQPTAEEPVESFENLLEELEEVGPIEEIDAVQPADSFESVLDDLDVIESDTQEAVDEIETNDSIKSSLEELEEIEPFALIEQTNEEEQVQSIESVLEEIIPFEREQLGHSNQLVEEILTEENHKIMDDIEDITTSEEMQKGDTIVEEYVQEAKDDDNILEEISPSRSEIQRQMLQTMVAQINFSKLRLPNDEYEDLVRAYMQPAMPAHEYYTFAYLLIEHYINNGQNDKLMILINELYNKFEKYPAIKLQLDYLIEKYNKI